MEIITEESIRPKQLIDDVQRYIDNDIDFLLSTKEQWVEVSCPACGSISKIEKLEKNGFIYDSCLGCGTWYINPRPTFEILGEFYNRSENYAYWNACIFPASQEVRRKNIFQPRVKRIIEICREHHIIMNTLVEVGCGYGLFCEEILKSNEFQRVIGIEPNSDLAETCKLKGIDIINLPVEDVTEEYIADVVVSFEVIEHLFSVEQYLKKCRSMLKNEGIVVIACPNINGFDISTLRGQSDTIDHEHLNYFNPESMELLFHRCGFKVIDCCTPGKLDVDIVRNKYLEGKIDLDGQIFLQNIINADVETRNNFQKFLEENNMSTHMWTIGVKISE